VTDWNQASAKPGKLGVELDADGLAAWLWEELFAAVLMASRLYKERSPQAKSNAEI